MRAPLGREYLVQKQAIKERLLLMSGHVETMIGDAMHALTRHDVSLAQRTAGHDVLVNRLEIDLDERCVAVLARFHPVASELRFLTLALKMVTDLERIGDLAANICERVDAVRQPAGPFTWDRATRMGQLSQQMVHNAVSAFLDMDTERARHVIAEDDEVDRLHDEFFNQVFDAMRKEPRSMQAGIHALSIGKWLERIADHGTNLAEHAIYLAKGEDIRHPASTETTGVKGETAENESKILSSS